MKLCQLSFMFFCQLSFWMTSAAAVFEHESLVLPDNLDEINDRDLASLLSNIASNCGQRLTRCETGLGGATVPSAQWVSEIEKMDSGYSEELISLIEAVPAADFTPIVKAVKENGLDMSVVRELLSNTKVAAQQTTDQIRNIVSTIVGVLNTVLSAVGITNPFGDDQSIELVIFAVQFVIGFIAVIPQGTVPIIIYAVTQFAAFLTAFGTGLATVAFSDTADPTCVASLMSCEFNKLMLNVIPSAVGLSFLADGVA